MKTTTYSLLALAAAAKLATAHTTVMAALINGKDQGLGNSASGYIRSPPSNSPITDVTSKDMACNVGGTKAAAKTLEVKAGDEFTFEWHHNGRSDSDDIIDPSHKGPVLVYMAPTEKGSAGNGWVKIAEDGFSGGKWAVDKLIANKGKHSVTIPNVKAGSYLLRPEIIALHEGNRVGGAQLYMECVQIKVTSDGPTTLPEGVSFPGAYTAQDKGILFNLYNSFSSYPIPGPKVFSAGSSPAAAAAPAAAAPAAAAPAQSSAPAQAAAPAASPAPAADSGDDDEACPADEEPETPAADASPAPAADASPAPAAGGAVGAAAAKYYQCGGKGFTGPTACVEGSTCKFQNDYYSQCI